MLATSRVEAAASAAKIALYFLMLYDEYLHLSVIVTFRIFSASPGTFFRFFFSLKAEENVSYCFCRAIPSHKDREEDDLPWTPRQLSRLFRAHSQGHGRKSLEQAGLDTRLRDSRTPVRRERERRLCRASRRNLLSCFRRQRMRMTLCLGLLCALYTLDPAPCYGG